MTQPNMADSDLRELRALEEIERNPRISQRQLATELGVALGVANACVHTLVRKGLVKIRGESNRSLSYHLTKQGVLHKASLAIEWTNNTINDYVQARARMRRQLDGLAASGVRRVVVLGADEVSELVTLIAPQAGIEVVAAVRLGTPPIAETLAGVPVLDIAQVRDESIDAAVVASLRTDIPVRVADALAGTPVIDLSGQRLERSVS